MPKENNKILKHNHGESSMKVLIVEIYNVCLKK